MNSTPCLTDDQIDDALIGDLAPGCAEHLAGCGMCQLRLAEAEAPIASFNEVSLAWSERRSATLPTRPVGSARMAWLPKAAWAATAAAVLAVGLAIPIAHHRADGADALAASHGPSTITLMAATGPVENPVTAREEQIARDNQMLRSIDREIDSADASPAQMYGVPPVSHFSSSPIAAAVRD